MLEVIALYFADIVFNIRVLLIIFSILAFILLLIDIGYGDDIEDGVNEKADVEEDKLINAHDKVRFWIVLIFTILVSGTVFLPSKEFILKMYGM